jgi:amino acid adenylation domain-containing protein
MSTANDRDVLVDRVARLPADRRELIERLLKSRASTGNGHLVPIAPRSQSGMLPLSYAQQRLWFLHKLAGEEPYYNIDYARRFSITIDFTLLERAINEIVRRHESLRTTIQTVDGEPVQVIAAELEVPIVRVDLSGLQAMRAESEAARLALEEARQPFSLERGPLVRVKVLKLADDDYILLLTMHHIVCDAWSMMVFARELTGLYRGFIQSQASPLPELPIQYADYAIWQRSWLQGGVLHEQLAYWRKQLAGLPTLRLPTDRPRPAVQSYRGSSWYLRLPPGITEEARSFSQREGVTLFMTLLTAYVILLHRYSGQDDIVVGAPVANRNRPETQGLIGFFVNTLVMRANVAGNPTGRELLRRVQAIVTEAFAHQDAPFESLVEQLQPERDLSRNPVYQVSLQVYQHATGGFGDQNLMRDRVQVDKGTASIDLAFDVFDVPEGLMVRIEYSTDLFDRATIERMVDHFRMLLSGVTENPDMPVGELPMLTPEERQQLLVTWNRTDADYPRNACLHDAFCAQAARTPGAIAVVSADGDLSYGELDRRSTRLAWHLRSLGVGPNVLVGICTDRSPEMIVGLLAILKAGGAYLPLDAAYPKERLSALLADAAPPVVLTQSSVLDRLPSTPSTLIRLDLDETDGRDLPATPPQSGVTPADLAYVIYTSGSTGEPNGVMIEHRSACTQLGWMQHAFPLTPNDRVIHKYSLAFDAAVLEIFCPLAIGAPIVLAGRDQRVDPAELLKTIIRHEITVLDVVPSLLAAFVELDALRDCSALRRIVCGGEAMPPDLPARVMEQRPVELVNMYGPTETTINATFWRYDPAGPADIVPIGRPCGNTQVYILDERHNPVPVGVPGEIHIGGAGVARGYLNRSALTAGRFVPNPFGEEPGARLFRTGDRGRYLPSGDIEFLGRMDGQVKISGFRVETGEIQTLITSHPTVRATHVVARDTEQGRKRLVAYVVTRAEEPEIWPSLGEYLIYDELTYYAMTHDEARNRAYRLAISGQVKGRTVVDIGTGADALWARWCVAQGARHVYAIEMLDHAYAQAKSLLARLGLEDRITLLHGDSRQLVLPEPVDVSISELIGTIGSSEGAVPILNDARRFLRPGGTTIPYRCITRIAAVSLPSNLRARPRLTELTSAYVDKVFDSVGCRFPLRLCLKDLPDDAIVSEAGDFEDLDFTDHIEFAQANPLALAITRDATIDGFLLWVQLYPSADQLIDVMSGEHSWLPVFFPAFHPGLDVRAGDRIEGEATVLDNGTLMPDYRVRGQVRHASGAATPFDYTSYLRAPSIKPGSFHDALLSATPLAERVRPGQGVSARRQLVEELRSHLRQRVPDYMVPSAFVLLKALPLTRTGKIDVRALPDPERDQEEERAGEFVSPRTELEWTIAKLWQELLGVGRVGIHENFFDLGGHSLMILRLQDRMRRQLGVEVSLTDLFQFPTVSALAAALASSPSADAHARGGSPVVSAHQEQGAVT